MAGRKSKTATAAKPKPKSGPKAGGAVKTAAKSSAKAKVARTSKSKASATTPTKAVDQVLAVAKDVQKAAKKTSTRKKNDQKKLSKIAEVHAELEHLAAYIDAAKREIAEIRPHDVKEEFLPSATDELDAIVEATADATNAIMDSCEIVEGVMGEVDAGVSTKLMDATTRIYEACTFQDITGQRIGKVVGALKSIEERIDALMDTLGEDSAPPRQKKTAKSGAKKPAKRKPADTPKSKQDITDADLLEGPQLGDKAKSQAEIDALLASFD